MRPTTAWFNNDTNNKIDTNILSALGAAIKDTDAKPIVNETNNDTDAEVDISIFIGRVISKTNGELIMTGLHRTNIIVRKKVYESNLF